MSNLSVTKCNTALPIWHDSLRNLVISLSSWSPLGPFYPRNNNSSSWPQLTCIWVGIWLTCLEEHTSIYQGFTACLSNWRRILGTCTLQYCLEARKRKYGKYIHHHEVNGSCHITSSQSSYPYIVGMISWRLSWGTTWKWYPKRMRQYSLRCGIYLKPTLSIWCHVLNKWSI